MAIRNTLKAYERLKREQHIDTLFRKGKAFSVFPLRFIYLYAPRGAELSPVRAGFSVSKKKCRNAVNRNRVRRLMRETWRTQKHALYQSILPDQQLHLFIIYTDVTLPEYEALKATMAQGIERLQKMQHA